MRLLCRYLLHLSRSHSIDSLAAISAKLIKAQKKPLADSAGVNRSVGQACQACMPPCLQRLQQASKEHNSLSKAVMSSCPDLLIGRVYFKYKC